MVYTYLPGVLVCYMQLISRKASVRLPHWMKVWMDGRKQLGLLALAASGLMLRGCLPFCRLLQMLRAAS